MAKIDLKALPPITLVRQTIMVTDDRAPGQSFSFDFAFCPVPSEAEDLLLVDRAERYEDTFVKGDIPIIAPGGMRVPVERSLCLWIARFTAAEEATGTLEVNSFTDWAIFASLMPSAWSELRARFDEAEAKAQGRVKPAETTDESIADTAAHTESKAGNA